MRNTYLFTLLGILDGKHYNQSIKCHKRMFEALYRCYWSEFESWLRREDMEFRLDALNAALNKLKSAFEVEKLWIEMPDIHDKLPVLKICLYLSANLSHYIYVALNAEILKCYY